jgi:hypothetical protein
LKGKDYKLTKPGSAYKMKTELKGSHPVSEQRFSRQYAKVSIVRGQELKTKGDITEDRKAKKRAEKRQRSEIKGIQRWAPRIARFSSSAHSIKLLGRNFRQLNYRGRKPASILATGEPWSAELVIFRFAGYLSAYAGPSQAGFDVGQHHAPITICFW